MSAVLASTPSRQVIGACPHDCPDTCSLVTTVENGIAVKVHGNPAHKPTDGVLCAKVSKYVERTYHAERVLQPMRRVGPKGSGRFEPVSWDVALDDIAGRLKSIAARDPQAILPYSYCGTMGLVQGEGMSARFFNRLGASLLERTICSSAGGTGLLHTIGGKVGMKTEFYAEARLIVLWGTNSITSNLHFWRIVQEAKRNGARLVCIDPRRTETAEKCHEHLQILPGTDAALALALMHELVVNGWLDHDFIREHTLGWDGLRERAMRWTPERAAAVCGIPAQQIRDLARDYGTIKPAAIRLNYGMQRVRGGGNAARAVTCLPALTGAWRHRGGGLLLSSAGWFPVDRARLQRPDLLAGRKPRTINMCTIGDSLQRPASDTFGPAVEAVVVYNCNPLAVAPDSSQVAAGFARPDLFTVVLEHFMTDTADYADYVLPATTQLEHWDIHVAYGHTDVLLNRPAVAPVGQARSNAQVFRDLAARMGFDDPCFQDSDEAMCRQAYGERVDWNLLVEQGYAPLDVADAPFADGRFPTASGKCEFFSAELARRGQDGLPDHLPNYEPLGSSPRFPLAMISPPARNFLNSTFVNVKSLRAIEHEPVLEIHAADAASRGITSGSTVRVFNDRGEYRCKATVTDRARPGVVIGLGVWWRKFGVDGTNINELTSQRLTDMGNGPVFYDCLVEVQNDASPSFQRKLEATASDAAGSSGSQLSLGRRAPSFQPKLESTADGAADVSDAAGSSGSQPFPGRPAPPASA